MITVENNHTPTEQAIIQAWTDWQQSGHKSAWAAIVDWHEKEVDKLKRVANASPSDQGKVACELFDEVKRLQIENYRLLRRISQLEVGEVNATS